MYIYIYEQYNHDSPVNQRPRLFTRRTFAPAHSAGGHGVKKTNAADGPSKLFDRAWMVIYIKWDIKKMIGLTKQNRDILGI